MLEAASLSPSREGVSTRSGVVHWCGCGARLVVGPRPVSSEVDERCKSSTVGNGLHVCIARR